MTNNPYGPDKACQRSACVAENQEDVPGAAVGNHLGRAHLDPTDRARYDGISISYAAAPLAVKSASRDLLVAVGAFSRPTFNEHQMRPAADRAMDACLREIFRLQQQVARVQVDADHKIIDANRRALDCDHHGQQIRDTEAQAAAWEKSHDRAERARHALLDEHQALGELIDQWDRTDAANRTTTADDLIAALRTAHTKTSRAHACAWNH